jgi:hypothetical protein
MWIASRARRRAHHRSRSTRRTRSLAAALTTAALAAVPSLIASGCGTSRPRPLAPATIAEAQTFPYFPVYWVGPSFEGQPLDAVDGRKTYINNVGESVYYGDCSHEKGIFGGGSCMLPLQVTTSIWHLHTNASLGGQNNLLIRGVPATAYNEGRSIELYTGQLQVDVFSETPARALRAALRLVPINEPGSAAERLPEPVFCPELVGPVDARLEGVLNRLPGHVCQLLRQAKEIKERLA